MNEELIDKIATGLANIRVHEALPEDQVVDQDAMGNYVYTKGAQKFFDHMYNYYYEKINELQRND